MIQKIPYNEYKFLVTNEQLAYLKRVLHAYCGSSDPYPSGVVDSIYYDSLDRRSYRQCLDGEPIKRKFRLRGYGDGLFHQMHLKQKDLFTVSKLKSRIRPVGCERNAAPSWQELVPVEGDDGGFAQIQTYASLWGSLEPLVRVRYFRYRFRINDYRLTLDTNIEIFGFSNGWDLGLDYALIPYHVLEVKTVDPRPHLPFLGLTQLPQISFSKFYLGINLLERRELA